MVTDVLQPTMSDQTHLDISQVKQKRETRQGDEDTRLLSHGREAAGWRNKTS